jgi:hypothetical protein
MLKIEALAGAIAHAYGALNPESESFACLNPGMLRSHSLDRILPVNESGVRVFSSFQGGWRALIENLVAKCKGNTHAKGESGSRITTESTLADLLKSFRYVPVKPVVDYLQTAIGDSAITEHTPLLYFIED